ncbi:MAG: hypothetical protein ACLRWQ_18770 [Flavonifractor plautii]
MVNGQPVGGGGGPPGVLADAATQQAGLAWAVITEFQGTDGGPSARSAFLSRVRLARNHGASGDSRRAHALQ